MSLRSLSLCLDFSSILPFDPILPLCPFLFSFFVFFYFSFLIYVLHLPVSLWAFEFSSSDIWVPNCFPKKNTWNNSWDCLLLKECQISFSYDSSHIYTCDRSTSRIGLLSVSLRSKWRIWSTLVPVLFAIFSRDVYEDIDGRITKSASDSKQER